MFASSCITNAAHILLANQPSWHRTVLRCALAVVITLTLFSSAILPAQAATCPAGSFDMLQYMRGDGGQTLHTTDDQFKTLLDGMTINGKTGFYIIKNKPGNVFEEFTYDNQFIYHLKDTSWATETGNVQCNGHDAGFTLLDGCIDQQRAGTLIGSATEGAKWFPVCMEKDKPYSFETTVTGFDKTTCQACSAPFTGCATRTVKITETGIDGSLELPDGQKSVELHDAIRVAIEGGPGAGENYIYDPKWGWVGFGRTSQITSITHEVVPKISYSAVQACSAISPSGPVVVAPEKYYVQPINGVTSQQETLLRAEARLIDPKGDTQLDIIRDELIMQGYEARCAAPGIEITLTDSGRDAMEKLFVQPGINGVVVGGGGTDAGGRTTSTEKVYSRLDVDYRDILVPLFRDLDRTEPKLKRSIEDFFGFREANDTVYTSSELKTAAINSLLSNQQRCTVAYQNLLAQDTMCKKLKDPSQCALYETAIPNTAYTVKTLFDEFEQTRGQTPIIQFCQNVMGATSGVTNDLRMGMANAPLTIEKAYRLAFMVTSIRLRNPNPSRLNNLFTHPLGGWMGPPKPNHAVAVVAFKIPDVLTNKGFNDGYTTDTAYADVGTLTKNSLITEPAQAKIDAEAMLRRRRLLAKARQLSTIVHHDSWAEISCLGGGTKTNGIGSPQCRDPLSKALVDIINAQAILQKDIVVASPSATFTEQNADTEDGKLELKDPVFNGGFGDLLDQYNEDGELACSDKYETGVTINDPGVINDPNDLSHVFAENWGAALLANLFGDCTHNSPIGNSASYASTQDLSQGNCDEDWYLKSKFFVVDKMLAKNGDDDGLAVKHFLVYPTGYELRTVEGVLAGSFFTKQQLTDILELQKNKPSDTEKIVDQFRLEGSKIGFTGGEGGYSYLDVVDCPLVEKTRTLPDGTKEKYKVPECPTRSFSFRLVMEAAKSANILGAKLGYWMRKVQLTLNATTQKSHAYLKTCASLEEFLLDRCGGGSASASILQPGQSNNAPRGDGTWVGDTCVSSTKLEDFDYYGVSDLPTTGRATYYGLNVFNNTLNNKLSGGRFGNDFVGNTTLKSCELVGATIADAQAAASQIGQEYVGCVALLRVGDLYYKKGWGTPAHDPNSLRSVWLKNSAGEVHGPFAVLDVSAAAHAPCHYDQNWAVDIDYNSFQRLFKQTGGPDQATVCDSPSC